MAARNFQNFYIGYCASLLGTALSSVAIAFAVLGDGGTATGLGVVFTASIAPMIVFLLCEVSPVECPQVQHRVGGHDELVAEAVGG